MREGVVTPLERPVGSRDAPILTLKKVYKGRCKKPNVKLVSATFASRRLYKVMFGKMFVERESSDSLSVLSLAMRAARTEDTTENRETQLIFTEGSSDHMFPKGMFPGEAG